MNEETGDWARLCALLDDDPELEPSVRQAVSDPAGYFAAHEDDLRRRGITAPDAVDAWLVLIDGLDDAGALAYLDQQDAGAELADALPALPRIVQAGIDVDAVGDVEGDLPAAIMRADQLLAPHDLRLVYLEEDPDAFPLVAVSSAYVDEIIAIAARLGRNAEVFD